MDLNLAAYIYLNVSNDTKPWLVTFSNRPLQTVFKVSSWVKKRGAA